MTPATLRIGVAGGYRGGGFLAGVRALGERAAVTAVYDPRPDVRASFAREHGVEHECGSFAELVERVDAVVLSSPQQHHAPQAVQALAAGRHVLSEVPAAISLRQAEELLAAVRASDATFMLAENYCYLRSNLVVREMCRAGLFGELYYAEGEYLHEMKASHRLPDGTPTWRYHWQVGRDAHTYPTHSLGPLLQWLDDRVVAVSAVGSGHHVDPEHELSDTVTVTARTRRGALLRLRLDLLSNRPHVFDYYGLQGVIGAYESGRATGEASKVYLHDDGKPLAWEPLDAYVERFLPARYASPPPDARHWGSDAFPVLDFVDAVHERTPPPIDVYAALDMTLPGIVSERSVALSGAWVDVPDPRHLSAGIGVDPGREAPLA